MSLSRRLFLALLLLLSSSQALSNPLEKPFDHSHAAFSKVLATHVQNGRVDYAAIKARPAELNAYLGTLAAVSATQYDAMTSPQKLALSLNAYNAFVLQQVALAWPIKQVLDIPGLFKTRTFQVMGRSLTLDQLENDHIRPQFNEPRIHFALNCAAVSCPPLQSTAFTAASVETQLESLAKSFARSPLALKVDVAANTVALSQIFDWFGTDFIRRYATGGARVPYTQAQTAVLEFLATMNDDANTKLFLKGTPKIQYTPYDWTVNAQIKP